LAPPDESYIEWSNGAGVRVDRGVPPGVASLQGKPVPHCERFVDELFVDEFLDAQGIAGRVRVEAGRSDQADIGGPAQSAGRQLL
jgi:hypothetical protein